MHNVWAQINLKKGFMKNKDSVNKCPNVEKLVKQSAERMAALYDSSTNDTPDNVLRSYPNSKNIITAHKMLIDALLPGRIIPDHPEPFDVTEFLETRISDGFQLLKSALEKAIPFRWKSEAIQNNGTGKKHEVGSACIEILTQFAEVLPKIRKLIISDVKASYDGDPAALSYAEIQLAYPGILAIASHRIAHEFYLLNVPIIPRIMSEWVHSKTGVDINPGAEIGEGFFIDHATGVVIGETCVIGNQVKIYQGVTLGAKSTNIENGHAGQDSEQRHPTVEDGVVIYANATILGGKTIVGKNSTIGGNLFLTQSVAANSYVVADLPNVKIRSSVNSDPDHYSI